MGFVVVRESVVGKVPGSQEKSEEDRAADPQEKLGFRLQTMRK